MGVRVKVAVKEVDRGWRALRQMARTLKEAKSYVKVGYLDNGGEGSEARQGGITTAELAAVMEFGRRDGSIPARPHVGPTFDANRSKYIEDLKVLVKGIYEQKITVERALGIMGARMAADIKKTVTTGAGVPPPNAASTVQRKKSNRTLIDTARMIGAITWAVILADKEE